SANGGNGVHIEGTFTDQNVVAGNFIGVDVTGNARLGNSGHGVAIGGGARVNRIGHLFGQFFEERANIISTNGLNGPHIEGAGTDQNEVLGNRIGTDRTGTLPLGNALDGVRIIEFAANNLIGSRTAYASRNIISANGNEGIRIQNAATGNRVEANYIG